MLQLQNSFSEPEVLILPLILQNKTTIAEDLMKSHPKIQQGVVIYLDNLLSPDVELLTVLNKYIEYDNLNDKITSLKELFNTQLFLLLFLLQG